MHYSQDEVANIKLVVGDLIVSPNYYWDNTDLVEVVTYVGVEGIVLYTLGGGVVGEMERYTTTKKLVSSYHMFLHQGSEEYTAFLLKLDADREKAR